jgi:predicted aspartyl protease
MKFDYRNGLLYLPISVHYDSEITLTGIIDTGSAGTVVDVDCFNIDLLSCNARAVVVYGVGGSQEAFVQTVDFVKIGDSEVKDIEIEFCDLKDDFGFEAIIGSNLLDKLGAIIDYKQKEIFFA